MTSFVWYLSQPLPSTIPLEAESILQLSAMSAPPLDQGEILIIPKTFPSASHLVAIVERYKHVRLHGLQVDPLSFSSTYEEESRFSHDTWLSRIQNPLGKTFVSAVESRQRFTNEPPKILSGAENNDDGLQNLLRKEWVGIVTLLGPVRFPRELGDQQSDIKPWDVYIKHGKYSLALTDIELDEFEGAHVVYLIVGMFVLPHARRKGHAHRLVEAIIKTVQDEVIALGAVKAGITVQVEPGNVNARRLYESVGFEVWDEAVEIANRCGGASLTVSLVKEIYLKKPL